MGQLHDHAPRETREFATRLSFHSSLSIGEIKRYSSPYGMLVDLNLPRDDCLAARPAKEQTLA